MRITVVGAGVIGLSCAFRLREAGNDVTIVSARAVEDTTSMIAGGLIYPKDMAPRAASARWTATSVAEFGRLASEHGTGVRFLRGKLLHRTSAEWPAWSDAVLEMRRDTDVGPPWADALEFRTPLVDTTVYLGWLADQVSSMGVQMEYRQLHDLDEVRSDADVVVNASGLGSSSIVGDRSVTPLAGQVVHVADPGLTEWVVDEDHPDAFTYVIPHGDYAVCGGTEEVDRAGLEPSTDMTQDILRRCAELVPAIAGADVLRSKVGYRPVRPEVRLERVGDVIHCYGHGGAGVTLSWGCADDVAALAE